MANATRFPRELLSQPVETRLAYFRHKVIAHPRLKEAHQALADAIRQPGGASLILVFGPTGVGKTTLRLRMEKQLIEEAGGDVEQDKGRIPVAGMEAVAPGSGNFKWKDYYIRALTALDEPLIAHKIDNGVRRVRRDGGGQLVFAHNMMAPELRRALEQCLRHRRLAAFIVDEAQHLQKMASGRRLVDQMDALKSLANMSETTHVLVGTYELLGMADLSGQLNRRSIEIHFPRYRPDRSEDVLAFKSVLLTFQRHLPLVAEPDLVKHDEYFYERSVGCVGVLKHWLDRALAAALERGEDTLTQSLLEQYTEPARKLLRMAREIREGEERLDERKETRDELRRLLGMGVSGAEAEQEKDGSNGQRRGGRVGQRNPVRDPVGMSHGS
jgi:energy-coupling factor transporter ATP-binding protein EcfA2